MNPPPPPPDGLTAALDLLSRGRVSLAGALGPEPRGSDWAPQVERLAARLRGIHLDLQALARGDHRLQTVPEDGADLLAAGLEALARRSHRLAGAVRRAARGERGVQVHGAEEDALAEALQGWAREQDELIGLLDALAEGRRVRVAPRGPGDALLAALAGLADGQEQLKGALAGLTQGLPPSEEGQALLGGRVGRLARRVAELRRGVQAIAQGDTRFRLAPLRAGGEDPLADEFNQAQEVLARRAEESGQRLWLEQALSELTVALRGDLDREELARRALEVLAGRLEAPVSACYLPDEEGGLVLAAHRGFSHRLPLSNRIEAGRSLLGAAVEGRDVLALREVPADYLPLGSGLGEVGAGGLLLVPILHQGVCQGAAEFARLGPFSDREVELCRRASEPLAITLGMARARQASAAFLARTQALNEELRAQQEQLRGLHEEARLRSERLQASEEELRQQSEEMQALNEELEEKMLALEQRSAEAEASRRETAAMVENLLDAVISIDEAGLIRSVNPAVERMLGYTPAELIGRNVKILMPEPHRASHDGYLSHYLRTGEARIIGRGREISALTRDGQEIPVHLSVSEYRVGGIGGDGARRFFAGTLRDLREHRRFVEGMEQAMARLEESSRYKSEFLANMSHELRTPLNSLLLLARTLLDNEEGNLSADQLESLDIIHKGGRDLLTLINDILDLSKADAGKLSLQFEETSLRALVEGIARQVRPLAREKGLEFTVEWDPGAPDSVVWDDLRVEQVLKNLLSNAVKFTEAGRIQVRVSPVAALPLPGGGEGVALEIRDTGVGIPPERQGDIWEAFHQGDGSTGRRFGGTGLGLTISRQLARKMGGEIVLDESAPGRGSVFTLWLPRVGSPDPARAPAPSGGSGREGGGAQLDPGAGLAALPQAPRPGRPAPRPDEGGGEEPLEEDVLEDDRARLGPGEPALLIIEDDRAFARFVMKLARARGLKVLAATTGQAGLRLGLRHQPRAVLLDRSLPDMDGEEVLLAFKADPRTRGIPVHVVSSRDPEPGAVAELSLTYLQKPVEPGPLHRLLEGLQLVDPQAPILVIEDHLGTHDGLKRFFGRQGLPVECVASGEEALAALEGGRYRGLILDLDLPDMTGLELLKRRVARGGALPPVVVHTGKELDEVEYRALREFTDRIVVKGPDSPERLREEVSLFLHSVSQGPAPGAGLREGRVVAPREALAGRRILIVDDDVRNTFAMAKALRPHGLELVLADEGELALRKLEEHEGIDLVLMDIMMPGMDGYETMRRIRANPRWEGLPILALTAKAMPDDKHKCLEAGASDYLPKPVDLERLLALMQVWLSHRSG